jgi:hypothetical protein
MTKALAAGDPIFWPLRGLDCGTYWKAVEERVKRDVRLFRGRFTSYDVLNEVGGE